MKDNPLFKDGDLLWKDVIVRKIPELPYIPKAQFGTVSDIGRVFYESGPAQGHAVIAKLLSAAMESGHLKRGDPGVASSHFMALTIAENQHRLYVRDLPPLNRTQIRQTISRAVAAFMSGHAQASRS